LLAHSVKFRDRFRHISKVGQPPSHKGSVMWVKKLIYPPSHNSTNSQAGYPCCTINVAQASWDAKIAHHLTKGEWLLPLERCYTGSYTKLVQVL